MQNEGKVEIRQAVVNDSCSLRYLDTSLIQSISFRALNFGLNETVVMVSGLKNY